MAFATFVRWGGMAAMVGGVLFVVGNVITLLVLGFGQGVGSALVSSGLLLRFASTPAAEALVLLGLVGLYARQAEALGILGLNGFLAAFLGTVVGQSFALAGLLANLGWALFGASCLRAGIYPHAAAILLTIGAAVTGAAGALTSMGLSSILAYVSLGADTVFGGAIAWLGFSLFSRKDEDL